MIQQVVAAVLVDPAGRLLLHRRTGQVDWTLPGKVVMGGQTEQDCLHAMLFRELEISFRHAKFLGKFRGFGLPGWEVELLCLQPVDFVIRQLHLGLQWVTSSELLSHPVTEVEQRCLDELAESGIWPVMVPSRASGSVRMAS